MQEIKPKELSHFDLVDLSCWNCRGQLPNSAVFCPNCGAKQFDDKVNTHDQLKINLQHSFKQYLNDFLYQNFGAFKSKKILAAYDSDTLFKNQLDRQIESMISSLQKNEPSFSQQLINRNFYALVHQFLINQDKTTLGFPLKENIVAYLWEKWQDLNLLRMALDFLDFANEDDLVVYTDLSRVPVKHVKNALNNFLFPEVEERILLICDVNFIRNFKNGFALTDRGVYWKEPISKPQSISYDRIGALELTENWLTINGLFFNARLSLNIKLMLYLRMVIYLKNKD